MTRLAKIGAFVTRYYLTSLFFAIFGATCFCAGVYVTNQRAIAGVHQYQVAVNHAVLAAAQ